ncbi:hypothetical protein LCUFL03_330274 [Latilactobacillus curvatus]|nr:hypothetical protein LCUFL03_330274 [Latilactobacillus curvatus]
MLFQSIVLVLNGLLIVEDIVFWYFLNHLDVLKEASSGILKTYVQNYQ